MKKITIAIDGHSSCGKSSIAKALAKELGYSFIDTGAMYRAVTLYAIRNQLIQDGELKLVELLSQLDKIHIHFEYNPDVEKSEVYLNGSMVESEIRGMEVSSFVSKVAAVKEVRDQMVSLQRQMGKHKAVVMDGRDIGSVVFPKAELKLFVTAQDEVRAERRQKELAAKGIPVDFNEILNNIRERDYIDSNRSASPLVKTPDAITIDNSNMSIEEQNAYVLGLALDKIKA